jgi:hypothetical protein
MHTAAYGCTISLRYPPDKFPIHPTSDTIYLTPMKFLRFIAAGFINFFSITAPAPKDENRAALYIAGMLTAVLVFVVVVVSLAIHALRH